MSNCTHRVLSGQVDTYGEGIACTYHATDVQVSPPPYLWWLVGDRDMRSQLHARKDTSCVSEPAARTQRSPMPKWPRPPPQSTTKNQAVPFPRARASVRRFDLTRNETKKKTEIWSRMSYAPCVQGVPVSKMRTPNSRNCTSKPWPNLTENQICVVLSLRVHTPHHHHANEPWAGGREDPVGKEERPPDHTGRPHCNTSGGTLLESPGQRTWKSHCRD